VIHFELQKMRRKNAKFLTPSPPRDTEARNAQKVIFFLFLGVGSVLKYGGARGASFASVVAASHVKRFPEPFYSIRRLCGEYFFLDGLEDMALPEYAAFV